MQYVDTKTLKVDLVRIRIQSYYFKFHFVFQWLSVDEDKDLEHIGHVVFSQLMLRMQNVFFGPIWVSTCRSGTYFGG